jgi:hypothetical protein
MNLTERSPHRRPIYLLALLLPLAAACGSELATPEVSHPGETVSASSTGTTTSSSGGDHQPTTNELFGSSITKIVIEVDYASGSAPYTGQQLLFGDVWGVFKANSARLFEGTNKEITVPTELPQMEELKDVTGKEFTGEQILAIAAAHRDTPSSGDTASFYFVWLPGNYNDGKMVRTDVLGVSLGSSGVIAMFKEVIAGTSVGPLDNVAKYVEQATLVHEFGHAVGLVQNGIPTTSAHHDEPHGAHCTNTDCVMYYAIEGTQGAADFATKYVTSEGSILFADDCLADVDAMIKSAN